MQQKIDQLRKQLHKELSRASTVADVEALRVSYLGRKGPIQELMKDLRVLSKEERPQAGKGVNELKEEVSLALDQKRESFSEQEEKQQITKEWIDVTLPGRRRFPGRKHIVNQALDDILEILVGMGFSVQDGPCIETNYYNFEALNIDEDHPARDMQDTFYIDSKTVLRTHTSNVQIHVMEKTKPPIRIIAPGKAFRNEAISARSHVFFHQVEGLYIDKKVTFVDLLSTLREFLEKFIGPDVKTRFRPSYFPFVEPGMEVDIHCLVCHGEGCPVCKKTGWLEIWGAGMVHPEVLKAGGIDPEEYTGYAFGLGIERLTMIKHGIKDIRYFTENNLRFLEQFPAI